MSEDARASGVLTVKKLTNVLLSILDTHSNISIQQYLDCLMK